MSKVKADNITRHENRVTADDRSRLMGHRGAVLWFTGLSASGKSTLAMAVEAALVAHGCHPYVLDGDNIRLGLNRDLGFSPQDRHENIRRIGEVGRLLADAGLIAITAFISPYVADRNRAREVNPAGMFFEIFCSCPLDVCEKRDPKGLYRKARAGQLKEFTGIDAPYEPPEKPEIVLHTDRETIDQCVARVLTLLQQHGIISFPASDQ